MLGIRKDDTRLAPPSPMWPVWFGRLCEDQPFRDALPEDTVLEHIGSTALDIHAKPVIDVLALTDRASHVNHNALAALGYRIITEYAGPRRLFFVRGVGDLTTHHLVILPPAHPLARDYLEFRDTLRANEALRRSYEVHKLAISRHPGITRAMYTRLKSGFIRSVLAGRRTA